MPVRCAWLRWSVKPTEFSDAGDNNQDWWAQALQRRGFTSGDAGLTVTGLLGVALTSTRLFEWSRLPLVFSGIQG